MKHKFFILGSLLLACGSMMGQTTVKQTVTIDGQLVGKTVTNISFDGDNVLLKYTDGTEAEADMETVSIVFTYSEPTGISGASHLNDKGEMINDGSTSSPQGKRGGVYDLQGRRIQTSNFKLQTSSTSEAAKPSANLKKGIYILNGKKVVIK